MSINRPPIQVVLTAGETYSVCPCHNTKTPPWCDMSHRGLGICPVTLDVDTDQTVWICQCGKSTNYPHCDGSHDHDLNVKDI